MKKLIKKFAILAVISALLGYKATKDIQQKSNAEYVEPILTIEVEETVESETVDLFFQVVDKEDDTETVNIENTEEVSEGLATVEPISTPTPEIEAEVKAEARVTVQPIINNTVPSNTPEPTPAVTPIPQPVMTPTPTATPVPTPINSTAFKYKTYALCIILCKACPV